MPTQLRLPLDLAPSHARSDFVVSQANREAVTMLDAWPDWPGGRLALIGPPGAGKSHLLQDWAAATGALDAIASCPGRDLTGERLFVENADLAPQDLLFHLLNVAGAQGTTLLLTARTRPAAWPAVIPDLRSRLNALTVAELGEPDDVLLAGVLRKLFKDRLIRPAADVIPFLLARMDRSVPAARALVSRIDEAASAAGRDINRTLVRQFFEKQAESLNLFEP
ncbi:MAG: chromosomal replication initiator DnaA [Caulobacteraceae bacterium]